MAKRRAMSSEKASYVKRKGHLDAKEFAYLIGLKDDYLNDPKAKKDVIDKSGDSYSVKSGEKKWQIFLYGETRFKEDFSFKAMNGIGQLLLECIECFPCAFRKYQKNKQFYKNKLQKLMIKLCKKLQDKNRLSAFIDKSMFNSGEVDYLSIKHENKYHVFSSKDVVKVLSENFTVQNSQARQRGQTSNQKVIFKVDKTYGEVEMRNDSPVHYREVKFWLAKKLALDLLLNKINFKRNYNERVLIYGNANKKFGRW